MLAVQHHPAPALITCLLMGKLGEMYPARPFCWASRCWQPSEMLWFTRWNERTASAHLSFAADKQAGVSPGQASFPHAVLSLRGLRSFREGREPEPGSTGACRITTALQYRIQRSRRDPEQNVGQPCIRTKVHTRLLKTIGKFDYSTAWQPERGDKQRARHLLSGL